MKKGMERMNRFAKVLLLLVLSLSLALGSIPALAETPKTTLVIWQWADQAFEPMAELFEAAHPDVDVQLVTVETTDYIAKLQIALTAGTDMPDIGALEIGWRGRLYDLDCWYDLEKEFGFDSSVLFDYAKTLGTNSKGEVVSIQWDCDVACMAYKKDLAEQYFGTSDPEELYAMMPDWDAFLAKGKEVKEASGGSVYMLTGLGDLKEVLFNQDQTPYIVDGKAELTTAFSGMFERMTQYRDAGIVDVLKPWSPPWFASFALDNHIFNPCATWFVKAAIDPNDPNGDGRWGLMKAPGGAYTWGGTALAVCKGSKNPQLAWEFIKTALLTQEGWNISKDPVGYFTTVKQAYEEPEYTSWITRVTGDQDIGKLFFRDLQPEGIKIRPITSWDHIITETFSLVMEELMADEGMTAEDALARMIEEVSNIATDIEVK